MKSTVSQILIMASLIAAAVLGFPLFRLFCLLLYAAPGEHTFVRASHTGIISSLLVSLSPLALYAASFALAGRAAWSRLGKVGFFVQLVYGLLLVGSSIYAYRLALSLDRTA